MVLDDRLDFADGDVVPVALILAEIAETFVRIEEEIFVPVVAFAVGENAAALEADHFVVGAAQFSARAERDHRFEFAGGGFELLKDGEIRIFRVEDRVTAVANDGDSLLKRAERDGCATLRTIQRFDLRLGRRGGRTRRLRWSRRLRRKWWPALITNPQTDEDF